jgi:hypothetical protein
MIFFEIPSRNGGGIFEGERIHRHRINAAFIAYYEPANKEETETDIYLKSGKKITALIRPVELDAILYEFSEFYSFEALEEMKTSEQVEEEDESGFFPQPPSE